MMFCTNSVWINSVWILAYPRTGSGHLRGLLNRMDIFPRKSFREHLQKAEFRHGFANDPFQYAYNKAMRPDFIKRGFTDECKKYIEIKLPGLRYISLKRRNVFETAVSLYFVKLTEVWEIKRERDLDNYFDINIPYDEKRLLDCYRECKDKYHCWDNYLLNTPHVEVVYEDLLHDPVDALRRIVNFMEIPIRTTATHLQGIVNRNRRQKMTRPETPEYIEKLKKLVENRL